MTAEPRRRNNMLVLKLTGTANSVFAKFRSMAGKEPALTLGEVARLKEVS